jgi:hypothetical protein
MNPFFLDTIAIMTTSCSDELYLLSLQVGSSHQYGFSAEPMERFGSIENQQWWVLIAWLGMGTTTNNSV